MTDGPTITVARAGELLHCSRARVFQLLAEGRLERAPRYGRKATVVTASVHALLGSPIAKVEKPKRHRVRPSTKDYRGAWDAGSA